ncbi:hypothetical protein M3O75_16885 [Klebsiella pneumoniae]|nr:hypothetical protein [Klebsiella pneumoniae]
MFVGNSLVVRLIDAWRSYRPGIRSTATAAPAYRWPDRHCGRRAARQRRPTLAIVGDLSALYDLNSLALLRQASAPLVLIVVNNNGGQIFLCCRRRRTNAVSSI